MEVEPTRALNESTNLTNKVSRKESKRSKPTANTSDSENLSSLRKEFDPADLETADTTMNETGEDTLDDEEVVSDLNSLDESSCFEPVKKGRKGRKSAGGGRKPKVASEGLARKRKSKGSGKKACDTEGSLREMIDDLVVTLVRKNMGLEEAGTNVGSGLAGPEAVGGRIAELALACTSGSQLLESVVREVVPALRGEEVEGGGGDSLDGGRLGKSRILKSVTESLCSFYLSRSHEKFKTT